MAQKSTELEQYLQRVRELEDMYRRLEEALEEERHARQDEEAVRRLQARWVNPDSDLGGLNPSSLFNVIITETGQFVEAIMLKFGSLLED